MNWYYHTGVTPKYQASTYIIYFKKFKLRFHTTNIVVMALGIEQTASLFYCVLITTQQSGEFVVPWFVSVRSALRDIEVTVNLFSLTAFKFKF
jgi:hypothetical protein